MAQYKSLVMDASSNGYLRTVCDYVHLNPVRAKLLSLGQKLGDYPWSSYGTNDASTFQVLPSMFARK